MSQSLSAAILIVSTTVSKGTSTDATEGILRSVFEEDGAGRWDIVDVKAVEDDVVQIQKQIQAWADGPDRLNLILTSGGTGFAVSDQTPEVCTSYSGIILQAVFDSIF